MISGIDLAENCYLFEFRRDTDTTQALEPMKRKEAENPWEGLLLSGDTTKSVKKVAVTLGRPAGTSWLGRWRHEP
jgi:hypothetical protein